MRRVHDPGNLPAKDRQAARTPARRKLLEGGNLIMPSKGQMKEGVDEAILTVLKKDRWIKTPTVARLCVGENKETVIDHLHRLAKRGKVLRTKRKAHGFRGWCFTWRLP